jgi:hypothetical protein
VNTTNKYLSTVSRVAPTQSSQDARNTPSTVSRAHPFLRGVCTVAWRRHRSRIWPACGAL